ncbi:alpha-L-rhamnosidase-related protein [Actinacidiphila rubida]|uniref:NPCBM-associated, NEW3 domain of alpha-galactosidase n=1 Tax=Actinacidiphila rubida TaxID=310780 RepID=A0A1H8SPB9_9ACTN|nr:discoidin domain-containing protein [Actinacidiphila rubida]SEO80168.1 NPCBM-associated, NEW3 domain of alpha-galactosidase [Actinacidiphila rubida]
MATPHRAVHPRGRRRLGFCLALAGMTLAGLPAAGATAAATTTAGSALPAGTAAASHDRPGDADNFAPATRTVAPVRVTRTTGSVTDPGGLLDGRPTALTGADSSLTLDFGKEVGGLVTLRFTNGATAGSRLGLAFTESSQYIGTTSDASNGGGGSDGAIFADVAPGASWTMPAASLRGGFRYLTLFGTSGTPVALDQVSLAISFAPTMTDLRAYANSFSSSDPLLNRIWYAGAYTVQTNTIAPTTGRVWGPPATGWDNSATVGTGDTVLVDGAKRDRTVWPGDLGVSVPTEYASLGDLTPTRNALTTLYQHQAASGELPFAGPQVNFYGSDTYHLWTLIGTANYYQYAHDRAWLDGEWAGYRRAVAFSLAKVQPDGLMSVTGTADWARGGQGGENIEANALLYQALVTGAALADVEGDAQSGSAWTAAAAKLKEAVNSTLWDEAAGQYRDNPGSDLHPQDGNSAAVWFQVAPADRALRVSAALSRNWNAYGATTPEKNGEIATFPGSMELQAHLQAGDATRALDLMRREWGYMLDSPLGTGSTFWEGYLADGRLGYGGAYMSAAHGWATGPTSALTFYVLGIRPQSVTGGYALRPEPGDLASAQGSLRTPLGDIRLAWHHDVSARTFTEKVDAPAAAVTEVDVPTFGARTRVTVNGSVVWNGRSGSAYGAHTDGGYVVLRGVPSTADIGSQALGRVTTALSAAVTAAPSTPLRAGQTLTVPVTVSATGDTVLHGSVTAGLPAGWTADPAAFTVDTRDGPTDTVVPVTVHAPAGAAGGPQSLTFTASAGGASAHTAAQVLVFGVWPEGTTAAASSFHAPNVYEGQQRTYDPANALDGDPSTFWNDDTPGAFPDTLTVTSPADVTLHGVGFASMVDGVPTDFAVQTWDGTAWVTHAQVTGNTAVDRWVAFDSPVTTTSVRIVVNAAQTQNGDFSRVAELTP